MTAHLPGSRLLARPETVARGIHRAIGAGRSVVYLPWFWFWVMLPIRALPEPVFKRLPL